jgi:hypothetical protein
VASCLWLSDNIVILPMEKRAQLFYSNKTKGHFTLYSCMFHFNANDSFVELLIPSLTKIYIKSQNEKKLSRHLNT